MQTLQRTQFYPMWLAGLLLALVASWAQADFKMTDTNGKAHSLSGYKGKWVLVNYWATWCPPCLEEIPDLIALHENQKNNLVVLGVALDYRSAKQVTDFADGLLGHLPHRAGHSENHQPDRPGAGLAHDLSVQSGWQDGGPASGGDHSRGGGIVSRRSKYTQQKITVAG